MPASVESNKNLSPFEIEPQSSETLDDPTYIDQTSQLIIDALRKGYDILQMPAGDIYATGTETVTYHYEWNQDSKQLSRTKYNSPLEEPNIESNK